MGSLSWDITSAGEEHMLEVGAEGGVVEGALLLEEGAGEAFFLKRILGGNSEEKTTEMCKKVSLKVIYSF